MKKIILAFLMFISVSFYFSECKAITYVTDIVGTKYEEAVTYLIENNIISGYPDNTFKPEKTITRAEMTTVITKFNKIEVPKNTTSEFKDIDSHWGKNYINTLSSLGFVSGYENNDFRPDNEVTYAEVTAMLLNSLGYKEEIVAMDLGWPNNYISRADEMGFYDNLDASNPNKKMTRGEVGIFAYNCRKIIQEKYEIIKLDYDYISWFNGNLASVERNGKFGVINKVGKEIIPCNYEHVTCLKNGVVRIKQNGKYGIADSTGLEILPCNYDHIYYYNDNMTETETFRIYDNIFMVERFGKRGIVNNVGKEIIPCAYDEIMPWLNFICVVKDEKVGVFNIEGQEIKPCIFDDLEELSQDLLAVEVDNKYGIIDKTGKEIIPCSYDKIKMFFENFIAVKQGEKYGFFDESGEQIVNFIYDDICAELEGALIIQKDGKYGVIRDNGEEIISCNYDVIEPFSDTCVYAQKANIINYIDIYGNTIGDIEVYKYSDNKLKIIDSNGNEIDFEDDPLISGCVSKEYELEAKEDKGNVALKIKNKNTLKEANIFAVEEILFIDSNFILLKKEGKYFQFDDEGREIREYNYDFMSKITDKDMFIVSEIKETYRKYGLLNKYGEEVLPCDYDDIENFIENYAIIRKGHLYGLVNDNGEIVIDCDYDGLYVGTNNTLTAKKDSEYYIITLK